MSQYFFAYGTLRPGMVPAFLTAVADQLRVVGEGWVEGLMYDLGEYPGVVLDGCSGQRVSGVVYRLPEDEAELTMVLTRLDAYEEFDPAEKDASLFVRRGCLVAMADGFAKEAWIYTLARQPENGRVVAGGSWRNG